MVAAISKIKTAEDASEAAVKKAMESAQEIVRAAANAARERHKAILDDARKKRAGILQKAKQEADAACLPLDDAAKQDIQRVLNPDQTAFSQTVDTLAAALAKGR